MYVRKFGKSSRDWPDPGTDCHQTGFPRAANTYSRFLITNFFPEKRFVTHIHAPASIKAALRHGVGTQVIVREPLPSIASLCMKHDFPQNTPSDIEPALMRYHRYHQYVLKVVNSVKILDFHSVVDHTADFIEFMGSELSVPVSRSEILSRLPSLQKRFQEKESSKKVSGSSLPNADRDIAKKVYIDLIKSHPIYESVCGVYHQLLEKRSL